MKVTQCNLMAVAAGALILFFVTVTAAPMEQDDEPSENALGHPGSDGDYSQPWDAVDVAALRKLLLQIDEDRLGRVSRSWPSESRGWGARSGEGRLARQWRAADKRQVRFRQCYFNPISCFRK